MNYWIISPNASADSENQETWKELIQAHRVVFMGWGVDHNLGKMFADEVTKGDIVLVAQGANRNKRLFLCGFVSSDLQVEGITGMPANASYRTLQHVIDREQLERLSLDFNGCAYGDADRIPAIYKLKPWQNTHDNRVAQTLYRKIVEIMAQEEINKSIAILKAKKQIILQGPPGTGKTRLAKMIAEELIRNSVPPSIADAEIKRSVHVGQILSSVFDKSKFKIESINDAAIQVRPENGTSKNPYDVKFDKIRARFENKLWNSGDVKVGNDTYEAGLAKYLFDKEIELNKYAHVRLVQFHPAYSYEDFVRGITANATDVGVEYKTENKVLADFAERALQNWNDHNKAAETVSRDTWVINELMMFADLVADAITANGSYALNDSVSVYGVDFKDDNSAFRYTGKNRDTGERWEVDNSQRMKFKDIALSYVANAQNRRDIKALPGISGRAKEHATYDFLMLTKFREFLQSRPPFVPGTTPVPLKNYVLIIDEINRANLPAVLGELIYALEYRGEMVNSMYELDGDREIILPPNLYIIGTMNTADRSVGHIDYAIRRRFAFVDVLPKKEPIKTIAEPLFKEVSSLFIKNYDTIDWANPSLQKSEYIAPDFRAEDIWIGHSYFLTDKDGSDGKEELKMKLMYEVKPILKEYLKDGLLIDSSIKLVDKINNLDAFIS